jgi:hypothetical protein
VICNVEWKRNVNAKDKKNKDAKQRSLNSHFDDDIFTSTQIPTHFIVVPKQNVSMATDNEKDMDYSFDVGCSSCLGTPLPPLGENHTDLCEPVQADVFEEYTLHVYLNECNVKQKNKRHVNIGTVQLHVYAKKVVLVIFHKEFQRNKMLHEFHATRLIKSGLNSRYLMTSILLEFLEQHVIPTHYATTFQQIHFAVERAENTHIHFDDVFGLLRFYKKLGWKVLSVDDTTLQTAELSTPLLNFIHAARQQQTFSAPFKHITFHGKEERVRLHTWNEMHAVPHNSQAELQQDCTFLEPQSLFV